MLQFQKKYFTWSDHGIHSIPDSVDLKLEWGMKKFFVFSMSLSWLKMYIENYSAIN